MFHKWRRPVCVYGTGNVILMIRLNSHYGDYADSNALPNFYTISWKEITVQLNFLKGVGLVVKVPITQPL